VRQAVVLPVAPPEVVTVTTKPTTDCGFNPQAAPWIKGAKLQGVLTQETSAADMLVPDSVRVKLAKGEGQVLRQTRTTASTAGGHLRAA